MCNSFGKRPFLLIPPPLTFRSLLTDVILTAGPVFLHLCASGDLGSLHLVTCTFWGGALGSVVCFLQALRLF